MSRRAAIALAALAAAALAAAAFALGRWSRGEVRPEPVAGRYQVHAARRLLLLDTGTGELWLWRQGAWHPAARPPAAGSRDQAPEPGEEIYWEGAPAPAAVEGPPEPPQPGGPPPEEPGGRAETIEVPAGPRR